MDTSKPQAEKLAQLFHETYEYLAPEFGYSTRQESAKPWADVPERNRQLMIAVCREILDTRPSPLAAPREPELIQVCDTTQTPRRPREECTCGTIHDSYGPCDDYLVGGSGDCVYCEHTLACHWRTTQALAAECSRLRAALAALQAPTASGEPEREREVDALLKRFQDLTEWINLDPVDLSWLPVWQKERIEIRAALRARLLSAPDEPTMLSRPMQSSEPVEGAARAGRSAPLSRAAMAQIQEARQEWLHRGSDSLMDTKAQALERLRRLIENPVRASSSEESPALRSWPLFWCEKCKTHQAVTDTDPEMPHDLCCSVCGFIIAGYADPGRYVPKAASEEAR